MSNPFFREGEKPKYRVLRGINFHDKRAEPGEIRDDIPAQSVEWLLERKIIEEVKE